MGLNLNQNIVVKKQYGKISAILIDKVLVNLLYNAKDALTESSKSDKILTIKTTTVGTDKILIEITENGIGILPKNLNKIFNFGFTTKKSGLQCISPK